MSFAYIYVLHVNPLQALRPSIEPPIQTDVRWPGHRFTLTSVLCKMAGSNNIDSSRHSGNTPSRGKPEGFRVEKEHSWISSDLPVPSFRRELSRGFSEELDMAEEESTMIGVDVDGELANDLTVVVGKIMPGEPSPGGVVRVWVRLLLCLWMVLLLTLTEPHVLLLLYVLWACQVVKRE